MPSVGNSVAFQVSIATTNTPQQLPSFVLQNGGTFTAKFGNTASIELSPSSNVTTGTGYILSAGSSVQFSGNSTNQLYAVGTAGDVLSFLGN